MEVSASPIEIDGRHHVLANVRDVSERKEYEEQLAALGEASRELLLAETETDVAEIAVELTGAVLDRSLTTIWTANDHALRPLAVSERVASLADDATGAMDPIRAGTVEMDVFERGESRLVEEYDTVSNAAHPRMPLETRLLVPLDDYGLLGVGSTTDDIDSSLQELVSVLASTVQIAFDTLAAEQTVDDRSTAMDAATDGIGIADEHGTFNYVNDSLAALYGYDSPEQLVGTSWNRLYPDDEVERFESDVLSIVSERDGWRGDAVGLRADGSTVPQELSLAPLADGGSICIVRDISEAKAQERQLESLTEVSRELIPADSRAEIAQIGTEAVDNVLGFEVGCVRLFDSDTNQLERVAMTDGADALLESRTAYDLEATLAGRAFRDERTLANTATVTESDDPSVFENPSFHVPIGSDGVLTVVVRSHEEFDDRDVHLAEMLSMSMATAISRAERRRLLQAQKRELHQQHDQLETMVRINSLFKKTGEQLIKTTTRSELERTICDRLAQSEHYRSAWIGDVEGTGDHIIASVGSGVEDGYLETVNKLPLSSVANGTVARAIETGTVQIIRQYQQTGNEQSGTDDEFPEDVETIAAIPLLYGDHLFGILVVNSVREAVFNNKAAEVLESFGKMTGFAINAIRNRSMLVSDTVVELEFTMSDPSVFYSRVTADLDCRFRFERSVPIAEGRVINDHTVEGAEPDTVLEAAKGFDGIEDARAVAERDDRFVPQSVAPQSTVQLALEAGATLRSAQAANGKGTIVFEAPQTANVRDIVNTVESAFSNVELVAKRERERTVLSAEEFRESTAESLTEKQRAALESAYFAGYYDWPREITAEELAESMGISSSTLHQHLRKGIWSLLSAFLDSQ
ncbi:bacterio-opsin activator domain-containing protein [Natronorubrum bangense]|nr:bacterio-opsin activator domain-containing protein [Natronorubrum bangense]